MVMLLLQILLVMVSHHSSDAGGISLGATVAGVGIGAAMNNEGDTMFGGSFSSDMGGMAVTIGGDVYSDNTSSADQTTMGIKCKHGCINSCCTQQAS